jgi:signal transduction histidine kinase
MSSPSGVRASYRDRLPRLRPWQIDGAVASVLIAEMVLDAQGRVLVHGQRANDLGMYALIVVMAVPYLGHRRWPMASLAVVSAAVAVYSLAAYGPFPGLNEMFLLFGIALHSDRRRSAIAFLASLVTLAFALAVQPDGVPDGATVVSTFSLTAVAWLTGENIRHRRARWAALEERASMLEREREERTRQAVADERLRIARELHDVVAHSMSVIAVQSGVGNHVIDSQPEEAKRALAAIETTSRDALTEMRRLLGVLRSGDEDPGAALEPAPGLGDVDQLVCQVTEAGLVATLVVEGDPSEVPAAVGLSAYRIVQEALTNVLKHGGPTAQVRLRYSPGELAIDVVDPGPVGVNRGQHVVSAGHGLIGMRERVAVFGGEFTAGPRPGGGFQVSARLPLGTPVLT